MKKTAVVFLFGLVVGSVSFSQVTVDVTPDAVQNNVKIFSSVSVVSGNPNIAKLKIDVYGLTAEGLNANLYASNYGLAVFGGEGNTWWDTGEALVYRFTAYDATGSEVKEVSLTLKESVMRRGSDSEMKVVWYAGKNAPSSLKADAVCAKMVSDTVTAYRTPTAFPYNVTVSATNQFMFSSEDYVWARRTVNGAHGTKAFSQQDLTIEIK